mmetsp:Transcript_84179/g.234720  ORF Transcript_84179/g.234720 Transcript_84179/m.234720 type:complete len:279 (-) Transcript_84179:1766-2602(-)
MVHGQKPSGDAHKLVRELLSRHEFTNASLVILPLLLSVTATTLRRTEGAVGAPCTTIQDVAESPRLHWGRVAPARSRATLALPPERLTALEEDGVAEESAVSTRSVVPSKESVEPRVARRLEKVMHRLLALWHRIEVALPIRNDHVSAEAITPVVCACDLVCSLIGAPRPHACLLSGIWQLVLKHVRRPTVSVPHDGVLPCVLGHEAIRSDVVAINNQTVVYHRHPFLDLRQGGDVPTAVRHPATVILVSGMIRDPRPQVVDDNTISFNVKHDISAQC